MYLHLGQSVVVPFRDVVGIFDMDNSTASHLTRKFLTRAEREGWAVYVCDDLPGPSCSARTGQGGSASIFPSLSAALLRRREQQL